MWSVGGDALILLYNILHSIPTVVVVVGRNAYAYSKTRLLARRRKTL
jgi:hypothetical protein